jgi:hypothetical protein
MAKAATIIRLEVKNSRQMVHGRIVADSHRDGPASFQTEIFNETYSRRDHQIQSL